ncbi:hypothetical protein DFJ73DRAFT_846309 [Zopfochytrium polystomum]|nr:hypothetical protein DFJ73DRAFT_846309 [Zopfochytrium polystomum]
MKSIRTAASQCLLLAAVTPWTRSHAEIANAATASYPLVHHDDACAPTAYTGSACSSSIVSYGQAVPTGDQVALDALVKIELAPLAVMKNIDPTCFDAITNLTCFNTFPRCVNGKAQLSCYSSCLDTIALCTSAFKSLGVLPILYGSLNNCTYLSAYDSEPYPKTTCQTPISTAAANATNNSTSAGTDTTINLDDVVPGTSCPKFFVPNTRNGTSQNCNPTGCCVPCPVANFFYPVNAWNQGLLAFEISSGVSLVFCLFIIFTWLSSPSRRKHPSDLILHFAIAIMIWQSTFVFLYGEPRRVQCTDKVTKATFRNNALCGVQGALLMYSVHASASWVSVVIANIYATIVHRSHFFSDHKAAVVVIGWLLPGLLTTIPFLVDAVDASTGGLCFVHPNQANKFFFSFQAIWLIMSVVLSILTLIYVVKTHLAESLGGRDSGASSTGSAPTSLSAKPTGTTAASGGMGSGLKLNGGAHQGFVNKRERIVDLVSMNWRYMMLSITYVVAYAAYVIFFNKAVDVMANSSWQTPWVADWLSCVSNHPSSDNEVVQNDCAAKFHAELPPLGIVVFPNVFVSSLGVLVTITFCTQGQVVTEWKEALRRVGLPV